MNSHAGAVLDQLDRLFNRGTVAGLSEGALLNRYVADGDEAAFAALVARHGPMVLGVCRRVLRDERDVEDAFQATFLVLVRRAGAIRDGDLVGRWLHGVAHRVAVRARAHSARRFVHEQSVDEPIEPGSSGSASAEAERRELAAIVDEEVTRLPITLRAPVVLCYLEGMSHDEAARRLRWPIGTVRSRMARARDVLRLRLAGRGVTADGAAIVASLGRPPVPPEWLDATVCGSLNFATHPATAAAAIASARSVAIARRVLQTMLIAKFSYIGAAGLGVVLAFGGVQTLAFPGRGEARPIEQATAAVQPPVERAAPSRKPAAADPRAEERRLADKVEELQTRNDQLTTEIANLRAQLQVTRDQLDSVRGEQPKSAVRQAWAKAARAEPRADERLTREAVISIGDELDRAVHQLNDLQARLRKMDAQLGPVGRDRPLATGRPSSAVPPTAARKKDTPGDGERPQFVEVVGKIVVFSPDGRKVAAYDPQARKSQPVPLPPIRGVRREFLILAENPYPVAWRKVPGEIDTAQTPWFFALDLDRDNKVQRLSAFNALDGTYIGEEINEPVDRPSVKIYGQTVFSIGCRLYALSTQAKRWGMLEWPPGTTAKPTLRGHVYWAEKDGRLYRFNVANGRWEDIYAEAIGGEPAEGR